MAQEQLPASFTAFRVKVTDNDVARGPEAIPTAELPEHDVTVAVRFSALNYKDALSANGNRGVTTHYPHTPGIDAAGTVVASADPRFAVGDEVLCTGYDLGMNTPGGWGQLIRVPADWLVQLPAGLDHRSAMVLGTAGLTAALAIDRLELVGVTPGLGPVVVTGASGGVGSLAVAMLASRGYEVVASSGKPAAWPLLERLGASRLVAREEFAEVASRPLSKAEFGGAVDSVGGETLVNLLSRTAVGGAVAACGLVGGSKLATTMFPFILRGVSLLGVDSQHLSFQRRRELWRGLAAWWAEPGSASAYDRPDLVSEVGLGGLDEKIVAISGGEVTGRVVVNVAGSQQPA